uniref:Sperm surface protein Sp17 n=1 Tax=Pelusios castaneus TaxID=367368 RepID=A0A8C8RSH1_9SAUR
MSIPFSNTHHRIPLGFANLLEGLAREVLREQPEDIPAFAAKYFEELLDKREETRFDPAEWGAKLEDRFYNNRAFELREPDMHLPLEMSLYFSLHLPKDKAATRIQAAYRGYRARERVKKLKEPDQDATDLTEEI